MLLLVWGGRASPASKGRIDEPQSLKNYVTPRGLYRQDFLKELIAGKRKRGYLNLSLVVIAVKSFALRDELKKHTGKKSNPPPAWQNQLVRVARSGKAWGPLIRCCNFILVGKNIVLGMLRI